MARILLAEDDGATRDLVRRALEQDGHNVVLAEDGVEAKSVFDAGNDAYDLLVTDAEMPGIDGVSLARHALGSSPRTRVLLMSGYQDALARANALGSSRLGVIAKPFTLEQIRRSVSSVLS